MRGQSRKSRPKKAASRVADEVLQDVLPKGPARFPNNFLPPAVQAVEFREVPLPSSPLRHKGHMFGKEELGTEDGKTLYVANKFELRYVLFAQANKHQVARLPVKPVEVSRAVTAYNHYLTDLRERLHKAYFNRTLDQSAAERFVAETWRKLDLPEIEE